MERPGNRRAFLVGTVASAYSSPIPVMPTML